MNPIDILPVKTAIVGCGSISDIFFRNFTERFRIIDLVKCCSKGGTSAEAKARQYGVEKSTLEEILADPEIELIANLTPAMQHFDVIKAALEAGKHVYTEKVITPDYHMTQELIDLAEEKGLLLCSEPDHFMGSSWQCAREYIDAGIVGNVTSMVATVSQNIGAIADRLRFINEPAGGVAYDFGIYLITQMVSLLGPAKEVCGILTTQVSERVHQNVSNPYFGSSYTFQNEDIAAAVIRFANGAVAVIHLNGNSILEAPCQFLIYGTCGAFSMPSPAEFSGEMKLYRPGSFEPVPVPSAYGFDHDSRGVGAAEMAWSLRLGRTPRADARLGLHCQEIIQGIGESARTGKYYRLTTTCERPKPLPKGCRGLPGFSVDEESSLVLETVR